jgi:hypothetical protein
MRTKVRLAATGLAAAATIAAGSLLIASPAHADRARDCELLVASATVDFYLYQWYGIALGFDSRQAKAHLGSSIDAMDFWVEAC